MIARFYILLPLDLFITEAAEWPTVELTFTDHKITVCPPLLVAERPKPTDTVHAHATWVPGLPSFSENVLQTGLKIAQVNVLTVDIKKPDFDRSVPEQPSAGDPDPRLAFEAANAVLSRLRVYSRSPHIKPLVIGRDPWRLRYLTDDFLELEADPGKSRGRLSTVVALAPVALTPENMRMVGARWQTAEPYVWDELLLDARALLPDAGRAIVMASAALETFIEWALNILQEANPLPGKLWTWINNRGDWTKEPSVAEEYDNLLNVFTGNSLKDDQPQLWQQFKELRHARNSLSHQGVAIIGTESLEPDKAKQLVDAADKIAAWVELMLPEHHRRARTEAVGPFSRRLATQQESEALGPARITTGEIGPLPPGGVIGFAFDTKPQVEPDKNPEGVLPVDSATSGDASGAE